MPPIRTTISAKPVKTERTHEENQERAYIAASRRSDRSLEARIESARRASEIHKKRTGRGLRVTEQDVVNEEMYEEEEDDLPQQYRRLQAYMAMTNTANIFDGRLNSFLMSSIATRNMVNGGFMNPNMASHQPTPFFPYNPHQASTPTSATAQSPAHDQAPHQMYTPMPPPLHMMQQGTSSSSMLNSPIQSTLQGASQLTIAQRRASSSQSLSPTSKSPTSAPSPSQASPALHSVQQSPGRSNGVFNESSQTIDAHGSQQSPTYANTFSPYDYTNADMNNMYGNSGVNLLSSSLPVEAQQMFGTNAIDMSGFQYQNPYLMNSNHGMAIPAGGISYKYSPNATNLQKQAQDSRMPGGMNQTLSMSDYPSMGGRNSPRVEHSTSDMSAFDAYNSVNGNEFSDFFDSEGKQ
jgi:hypothetical protein